MIESSRARSWPAFGVALLALASSAVGYPNGFTYDDRYIIQLNAPLHTLHGWWRVFAESYWPKDWGGDGYRPLTVLAFKLEWALGGGSPLPFHLVNILVYAATAVLVFLLARRLLPLWAACLTGALFAVHPVHVEAVANVVGQSELLVALAMLPAVILYLDARRRGELRRKTGITIAVLYVVGCFAKEHGIVLPAILVAAELTVIDDQRPVRERVRALRPFYLALAAFAIAFIALRSMVLSDHGIGGFQPFTPFNSLHITGLDRVLTAVGVVPEWVRLFFWPVRLSSEYGPPDIDIAQGFRYWQLPGFLVLAATLVLGLILRRRQPVISFGIAFVCIALLPSSNFLVPAGIVLAERTLFLPSVGATLVLGAMALLVADSLLARYDRARVVRVGEVVCAVVLAAGALRSSMRTRVWRDNETLFNQAVLDSPRSYRAHYMLGAWSFEQKRKRIGEIEYRKALNLFPYDPFLSYNMAEQYRKVGMCEPAIPLYRWTRGLDPDFPLGRTAYAVCLIEVGAYDEAKSVAYEAMRVGGDLKLLRNMVQFADSAKAADAAKAGKPRAGIDGTPSKLPELVQKTAGSAQKSPLVAVPN